MVAFVVKTSATIYFFCVSWDCACGCEGGDVMVWCDVLSVRGCTESKFDVCQKMNVILLS